MALLSIEWGCQKSDPVGTPSHSGTHWNPDGFLLFVCYHSLDLLVHFCQVATLNYSWKSRKTTSLLILFTNYMYYLAQWHLDILLNYHDNCICIMFSFYFIFFFMFLGSFTREIWYVKCSLIQNFIHKDPKEQQWWIFPDKLGKLPENWCW